MDLQLKDKVIVITGGAKGIGAAITRTSVDEGAVPVIVDRDEKTLRQIEKELKAKHKQAVCIQAELSKPEECRRVVSEAHRQLGRIDALVNNAGIGQASVRSGERRPIRFWETTPEQWGRSSRSTPRRRSTWRARCCHTC